MDAFIHRGVSVGMDVRAFRVERLDARISLHVRSIICVILGETPV